MCPIFAVLNSGPKIAVFSVIAACIFLGRYWHL